MESDRLSRELREKLEAARMTAEALSLKAQLARDTVGKWIRGATVPTLAALRAVEGVLGDRLGYTVDMSAAVRERHNARQHDRQSADGAQRGEITVYLEALIRWLNADPWTQWFGRPALHPAAIERKLAISDGNDAQAQDADELARRSTRLVVLGGPGSGKTWLARRTARLCAETALERLSLGESLDQVELPLYTTCARIVAAPLTDGIRRAVVSSALSQLPDLGGSRILDAVRVLFEDRDAPTLLVADSLDEARGADERISLADTLPKSWRIVLTSRPGSWNHQLTLPPEKTDSHRVGELMPLRYPADVEPFIRHWFNRRPEHAEYLVAQIARRPSLQQAATVPLITAFYCIIGGAEPLPEFKHELYARVLRRMLTGRWRRSNRNDQVGTSTGWNTSEEIYLPTLRNWAWSKPSETHPVSGIGTWGDDIETEPCRADDAELEALDHIAAALGPADLDTGKTLRRFIHRSIREHLVAECIAELSVDEAVDALLPHLWYDPDWELVVPSAIIMHPHHDRILQDLIYRAAQSAQLPSDISAIDGGGEICKLLGRLALESRETDWSPATAQMIGNARVALTRSMDLDALGYAASWVKSNRRCLDVLVGMLANPAGSLDTTRLVAEVNQLFSTAEEQRQTRETLLELLSTQTRFREWDGWEATRLVDVITQLNPAREEKRQARIKLLSLLPGQSHNDLFQRLLHGAVKLAATQEDKREIRDALLSLLASPANGPMAVWLVNGLVKLAETPEDEREIQGAFLSLLTAYKDGETTQWLASGLVGLSHREEDKHEARSILLSLLATATNSWTAASLAENVMKLGPTDTDKRQAREKLLELADPSEGWTAPVLAELAATLEEKRQARDALLNILSARAIHGFVEPRLVDLVIQLVATTDDKRQVREKLLDMLNPELSSWAAVCLARSVTLLDPAPEDRGRAREKLLSLLAYEYRDDSAARLIETITQLTSTADEMREARTRLLTLMAGQVGRSIARELVLGVVRLARTFNDVDRTREALLTVLVTEGHGYVAGHLVDAVVQLATTAEVIGQVRRTLLRLIGSGAEPVHDVALSLVDGVVQLTPETEDKPQTRRDLLDLLVRQSDSWTAACLAGGILKLNPAADDERQACDALLALLDHGTDHWQAADLVAQVVKLHPTPQDLRRAREALLSLLSGHPYYRLVDSLVELSPTREDEFRACETLLKQMNLERDGSSLAGLVCLLAQLHPAPGDKLQAVRKITTLLESEDTDPYMAAELIEAMTQVDPAAHDLRNWGAWTQPPTADLLAAVRKNSTLPAWVATLPSLAPLTNRHDRES